MGFLDPLPPLSQNFHTKKFLLYEGVTKSQTPPPPLIVDVIYE